jgi:hypothetical protein
MDFVGRCENRLLARVKRRKRKGAFGAGLRHGCASCVSVKSRCPLKGRRASQDAGRRDSESRAGAASGAPTNGKNSKTKQQVPHTSQQQQRAGFGMTTKPNSEQQIPACGPSFVRTSGQARRDENKTEQRTAGPSHQPATTAGWVRDDNKTKQRTAGSLPTALPSSGQAGRPHTRREGATGFPSPRHSGQAE